MTFAPGEAFQIYSLFTIIIAALAWVAVYQRTILQSVHPPVSFTILDRNGISIRGSDGLRMQVEFRNIQILERTMTTVGPC